AVGLVVVSILGLVARREARESQRLLAISYQEVGRKLLVDEHRPLEAMVYLGAAHTLYKEEHSPESLRMQFESIVYVLRHFLLKKQDPVLDRITTAQFEQVWSDPVSRELPHRDEVISAVFSPDGKRIATASADHTAQIWDTASGERTSRPLEHQDRVTS